MTLLEMTFNNQMLNSNDHPRPIGLKVHKTIELRIYQFSSLQILKTFISNQVGGEKETEVSEHYRGCQRSEQD